MNVRVGAEKETIGTVISVAKQWCMRRTDQKRQKYSYKECRGKRGGAYERLYLFGSGCAT